MKKSMTIQGVLCALVLVVAFVGCKQASGGGDTGGGNNPPPVPTAPTAPTSVTAKSRSDKTITVSWAEVPGATSYKVYRSIVEHGLYLEIASVNAPTVEYTQTTNLNYATVYFYKVCAVNAVGDSDPSDAANELCVGPAGVSVVLNGKDGQSIRVSETTKKNILDAALKLGSASVSMLSGIIDSGSLVPASGGQNTIGLELIPSLSTMATPTM